MNTNIALGIRRLGPGDEKALTYLAEQDANFDLAERSKPLQVLSADAASRYLANPAVLHWVAYQDEQLVGFLYCLVLPMRAEVESEILLYEIGVHKDWRRQGIGRKLLTEMQNWMAENSVAEVWVLADNSGAQAFYKECGFTTDPQQPVYMILRI